MLCCPVLASVIGVSIRICSWPAVFEPHCFSLECFAASSALFCGVCVRLLHFCYEVGLGWISFLAL